MRTVFFLLLLTASAFAADISKFACFSSRANSGCEIGTSLVMKRTAVHIQPGVTRFPKFQSSDLRARFKGALDRMHRVPVCLSERLPPGHAAADALNLDRKHTVRILKIVRD